MLLDIHPDNPDLRKIKIVIDCLKSGGLVIFPTDSVYGLGCSLLSLKSIEEVAKIHGESKKKNFSIICYDLSHISDYALPIDNTVFKLMKQHLPGPFTFILNANNKVPKLFKKGSKRTLGIRIPNNAIPRMLVKELGNPLITSSVYDDDEIIEYTTDPELIYQRYKNKVDIVINGGMGHNTPTTVIDCTDTPYIVRQGIGEIVL